MNKTKVAFKIYKHLKKINFDLKKLKSEKIRLLMTDNEILNSLNYILDCNGQDKIYYRNNLYFAEIREVVGKEVKGNYFAKTYTTLLTKHKDYSFVYFLKEDIWDSSIYSYIKKDINCVYNKMFIDIKKGQLMLNSSKSPIPFNSIYKWDIKERFFKKEDLIKLEEEIKQQIKSKKEEEDEFEQKRINQMLELIKKEENESEEKE